MPRKSHRMASKQAQLSKKKRKGTPRVYIPPERTTQATQRAAVAEPRPEPQTKVTPLVSPRPAGKEKASTSVLAAHSYVWPEVKRIGLVTGLIFIILAVLTFVLR